MIRPPMSAHRLSVAPLVALVAAGLSHGAVGAERIAGPVAADVVRVVDGDTIEVRAEIWLDLAITVGVRLRGIDAPELRGRCLRETALARAATDRLAAAAGSGRLILTDIVHDKYAGRALADVATADGTDLAGLMLASGLARAYDGGTRGPWCGVADLGDGG